MQVLMAKVAGKRRTGWLRRWMVVADVRMISALADEEFLGRVRRVGGAVSRK